MIDAASNNTSKFGILHFSSLMHTYNNVPLWLIHLMSTQNKVSDFLNMVLYFPYNQKFNLVPFPCFVCAFFVYVRTIEEGGWGSHWSWILSHRIFVITQEKFDIISSLEVQGELTWWKYIYIYFSVIFLEDVFLFCKLY